MNYIKEILKTEEEANKIISDAKEKALKMISETRERSKKELSEFSNKLEEEKKAQIENQKKELAKLYKELVAEGEEIANRIITDAKKHEEELVKKIVKEIINT